MKRINLNDIPKQDPFVVPEGYLERLPQTIQERVSRPSAMGSLQSLFAMPRFQVAFAAFLILMVSIAVLVFYPSKQTAEPLQEPVMASTLLKQTSQQEIITYLSVNNNVSVQELANEGNWSTVPFSAELENSAALENEIIQHLDTYSAEELWK